MFSLVVTILSIVLVAGLAAVSVVYGGSALNTAGAKNSAAALLSQAQQLTAANALHFASTNEYAASAADLAAAGYLKATSIPTDLKHATTPDWVVVASVGGPPWSSISPYFQTSNYNSMDSTSPGEACRRAITAGFGAAEGEGALVKAWGTDLGCYRPLGATPSAMVYTQSTAGTWTGTVQMTMAQYNTVALAVGGSNAYVSLLTTGGASDEACKAVNQTAVGSSTIAGVASYPAGRGGLNNTAYGAVASNVAGVFSAMTVKFACARFGADNVLVYKG